MKQRHVIEFGYIRLLNSRAFTSPICIFCGLFCNSVYLGYANGRINGKLCIVNNLERSSHGIVELVLLACTWRG
jgi:hypothetical protein